MDDPELERHCQALADAANPGAGWEAARALARVHPLPPRALAALERVATDPARGALRAGAATALVAHHLRAGDVGGLRALASRLGRRGTYAEALYEAFDEAVRAGLDLGPALPFLLELHAEREAHRGVLPDRVTELLVGHARRAGDLERVVRGLLANPALEHLQLLHVARRRGCDLGPALPALVELLASPRLRVEASVTLALLARDGVDLSGVLRPLERRLDAAEADVRHHVAGALAHQHLRRGDWARLDALRARQREATDAVLLERLREGVADPELVARLAPPGTPIVACSICSHIPRRSWAAPDPRLREEGGARWCPECGRAYRCTVDEVDDGTSQLGIPSRRWEVVRLTPPETLALLDGEPLAARRRGHEAWLARLRAELLDPRPEVRAEAAIDLAACGDL